MKVTTVTANTYCDNNAAANFFLNPTAIHESTRSNHHKSLTLFLSFETRNNQCPRYSVKNSRDRIPFNSPDYEDDKVHYCSNENSEERYQQKECKCGVIRELNGTSNRYDVVIQHC